MEAAELTRALAASAYDAGCPYVDVIYGDDQLDLVRFQHAPADSFAEFPTWRVRGMIERAGQGAAFLTVAGGNPDLLKGQDPERVATTMRTASEQSKPFSRGYITNMRVELVRDLGGGGAVGREGVSRCAGAGAGRPPVGRHLPCLPRGSGRPGAGVAPGTSMPWRRAAGT